MNQADVYPAHRRDRGRGPQRVLHLMTARRLYLARVKEEASFEQILDRYGVKSRGAGAKRMACCPFHPDKRPSCSIHLERKVFYCFGCGAKGSVLDFVAKIESISIPEATERIEHICRLRHDAAVTERQATAIRPRPRSIRTAIATATVPAHARSSAPVSCRTGHRPRARRYVRPGVLQPRHHAGADLHADP